MSLANFMIKKNSVFNAYTNNSFFFSMSIPYQIYSKYLFLCQLNMSMKISGLFLLSMDHCYNYVNLPTVGLITVCSSSLTRNFKINVFDGSCKQWANYAAFDLIYAQTGGFTSYVQRCANVGILSLATK